MGFDLKNQSQKKTKIKYNIYYNFGTLLCLSTWLKMSDCYYVITPGPQDSNLLGQKREGISKAHISYILRHKKTWKSAKNRIILKYYD